MPTLSDARFDSLRGQGFTGATSDMLLQWLQANGASSPAVPDAWSEFLDNNGFTYGSRNDSWYAYLGSLGYEGSLNDRELQFWTDGGVVSTDGVRITQQPERYSNIEGTNAVFFVVATSGNGSNLSYLWSEYVNGVWGSVVDTGREAGIVNPNFSVSNIQVSDQGRRFRCAVTNSYNTINSQSADIRLTGAQYFIIDQLGNRMLTDEPADDNIMDERSI